MWIDGKTIYRKVYSFTTPSISGNPFINMSYIDTLVNMYGHILDLNNNIQIINTHYDADAFSSFFLNCDNGNMHCILSPVNINRPCTFIIEYTKK